LYFQRAGSHGEQNSVCLLLNVADRIHGGPLSLRGGAEQANEKAQE
jgi:hypothetical protein